MCLNTTKMPPSKIASPNFVALGCILFNLLGSIGLIKSNFNMFFREKVSICSEQKCCKTKTPQSSTVEIILSTQDVQSEGIRYLV